MIYFKKKSLIRKAINKIKENMENFKFPIFLLSKRLFFIFIFLIFGIYAFYLFLTPKYINAEIVENAINNYILKNNEYSLDISKFTIKPNYKFDINLKADSIKLLYPNKTDFVNIQKADIDVNLISLIFGYVDLNKIKTDKIEITTKFKKNKTYECLKYLNLNSDEQKSKIKLRNINLLSKSFNFNLYDENVNKKYNIKTNNLKVSTSEYKKQILITTKGIISSSNHKISDFDLNLSMKLNPNSVSKFRKKLQKINYNPFYYADKYKFYSKTKVDLKVILNNKTPNVSGLIFLNDYSFNLNGVQLPKNNLVLNLKNGKISTNCDFKFIKEQYIKIKSTLDFNNGNYIEAKLNSNELNLSDLREMLDVIGKIFNFKYDLSGINVFGFMNVDAYIKSDFKKINSNGKLLIKNAKITDKKTGLILKNINSNINFANNEIDILNTSAYVNDAKFNLTGKIDAKTNLNIKVNSDELNIAQVLALIKELPFSNVILPKIKNYEFKSGFLKINSTIEGNLKQPILNSNSALNNLKIYLKEYKSELFVPKFELKFLQKEIIIPKTQVIYEKIPFYIEGKIKDYKSKQPEAILNINSKLPKENKFLKIKDKEAILKCILNIKQNKILISSCDISNLIFITGDVNNLNKEPNLNIKLSIPNNSAFILPQFENLKFGAKGNILINGNIEKPDIIGNLNLSDIKLADMGLNISDLILNIKNSEFYLNISKGRIFDFDFDLISNAQFNKDKLIIKNAQIQSMYINLDSIEKYLKTSKSFKKFNFEINSLKGFVSTLETSDVLLNLVNFEGNIKNDILNISKFSAEVFNGKIIGFLNINLLNQKINSELILKELNIRQFSSKLKDFSIAASGKLSALINAEFIGFNFDNILNTLDGYIKFNIDNGELNQFAKLERFLQAGNILSQSILKLSLNSTLSALSKQNTGDFKTIEGTIKIKNSIANIQYINTQGSNMALHIEGDLNLLSQNMNAKILGRIPVSTVSVLGGIGKFSLSDKVDKMETQTKQTIENITSSPLEKRFSTNLSQNEINKIPSLAYYTGGIETREFLVLINGVIKNLNSIQEFKWIIK